MKYVIIPDEVDIQNIRLCQPDTTFDPLSQWVGRSILLSARRNRNPVGPCSLISRMSHINVYSFFYLLLSGFLAKPTRKAFLRSGFTSIYRHEIIRTTSNPAFTTKFFSVPVYTLPRMIGRWSLRVPELHVFLVKL